MEHVMNGSMMKGVSQISVRRGDGTLRRTVQSWQDGAPRADIYYDTAGFMRQRNLHSAGGCLDVEITYDRFMRLEQVRVAIFGCEIPRLIGRIALWANKIVWSKI